MSVIRILAAFAFALPMLTGGFAPARADCSDDIRQAQRKLPSVTDPRARLDAMRRLEQARTADQARDERACEAWAAPLGQLGAPPPVQVPRPLGFPTDLGRAR